jgi:hypothetical protein
MKSPKRVLGGEQHIRRYLVIASAVIVCLATSGLLMAEDDPFVGTWQLNVAKSHFDPGPPPKSQTRTWEPSGKVTVKGIDADGKPHTHGYTIKADGKDYPAAGGTNAPIADTVTTKRIDANTLLATLTGGGKLLETARFSVSKDGKVLTLESRNSTANPRYFHNIQVWDRQ